MIIPSCLTASGISVHKFTLRKKNENKKSSYGRRIAIMRSDSGSEQAITSNDKELWEFLQK